MSAVVAEQLAEVEARIAAACSRAGRRRDEVELIAVSKTFPAEAVADAAAAGQALFGESRWQEAEAKIAALPDSLRWHFIGGVQRNKVRKILPLFEAIHAVDSLKLAAYTGRVAAELGMSAKVFLQVNLAGEESKGGFSAGELRRELGAVMEVGNLEVLGLMTIPPEGPDAVRWFAELRELRDELSSASGAPMRFLSMGMSGDFEAAIGEGATHVRVGSAIFGHRAYRVDGELG